MQLGAINEYRLTRDEASALDIWHIVNTVVYRLAHDAPDLTDSDAMDEFFLSVLSVQSAVFSAWFSVNDAVVGGMWYIFENCSAPMVYKAIEGYELLYEPQPAQCLRRACAMFPGGTVPRSHQKVMDFLKSMKDEDIGDLEFEFEREKKIDAFFDFKKFYTKHCDCFVVPK